ncbi:SEC-C metal-binding domain-containing protein [Pseudomonas chlororaphis]|uniref:SEC-C metal-binding domain-containing protein n=1 Tax=Pseudomonas chlororaphis TaxID=587753 RepID=UPI0015DD5D25|nr:SEC-C metal-binding domain-containing protein [Pseudomonas chlororaphis]QLL14263.1 SEC-C domain-containing protein [Pseudomonas chlororaphis subsp. aurantiaca]
MRNNGRLTTPKKPDSPSLDFVRSLNPEAELIYVPVEPTSDSAPNECYSNVERLVKEEGGRKIMGWQVWEWPGYFAEAEYHAVWESPTNGLIDVTPKTEKQILFIADSKINFTGERINNIRSALIDAEVVHDFIALGNAKHAIFGHIPNGTRLETWKVVIGERLDQATALLPNLFKKGAKNNQPCPCSSGLKYQDCHRMEIKKTIEMAHKAIAGK